MSLEEVFFCPNCMAKISSEDVICPECGAKVKIQNAPHQLQINNILNGRYLIGRVLGEGGFGITYLGYNLRSNTKAAIKEYFPSGLSYRFSAQSNTVSVHDKASLPQFEKGKQRFLEEAKTVYRFKEEENIVDVLDFFSENNTAYIVMEYIDGISLSQYLKKNGPVNSFDELYKMLRPVMVSLSHVHDAGLIHRDISPSNLMIDKDGSVKLLDFGTARAMSEDGERSLSVVLKHGFAPMEQYKTHGRQGAWTDVYALCATMYKMLTGQTPTSAMDRMDNEMPLPSALGAKISPAQERILFKGLALPVGERIQSVSELIELFDSVTKSEPEEKTKGKKEASANDAEQVASEQKPSKKKNSTGLLIALCAVIIAAASYFAATKVLIPTVNYNAAVELMENGRYEEAIEAFEALDGYKDSADKIRECGTAILEIGYNNAIALMNEGKYEEAIAALENLNEYKDSNEQIAACEAAITDNKYNAAIALMDGGKYEEAIAAFEALDGYKDSAGKITECYYEIAVELKNAGRYEEAISAFSELGEYKDSSGQIENCRRLILTNAKIGDYVYFGSYEQDNDTTNGKEDIEWLVLDKQDDKILVISKYGLDAKQYNTLRTDIAWEKCTLRSWLNGDFYNAAFSADDKQAIVQTKVPAGRNPKYNTYPGNDTTDNVFLLSINEVNQYFSSDSARQCAASDYTIAQGALKNSSYMADGKAACWWWLRSPGYTQHDTAYVNIGGSVTHIGLYVNDDSGCVRPALWINLGVVDEISFLWEEIAENNGSNMVDDSADASVKDLTSAQVGDYVYFGTYEQDNDTSNGAEDIEWLVLDKQDNKILVISKYGLDTKPYNVGFDYVTWEKCTLRSWLNKVFYNAAFSADEKKVIVQAEVLGEKNPEYDTNPGNDTTDNVFLLSINEANKYFSSVSTRQYGATDYAIAQGAYATSNYCWWWLRTPGTSQRNVAICSNGGSVNGFADVSKDNVCVRPALWINLDA